MAVKSKAAKGILELIARGFPEGTAKKIVSGDLPMDQASRMARAKAQGFDVDNRLYHGTATDFNEFDPLTSGKTHNTGTFLSSSPDVAATYALGRGRERTIPVLAKRSAAAKVDAGGEYWNKISPSAEISYPDLEGVADIDSQLLGDLFDTPSAPLTIGRKGATARLGDELDLGIFDDFVSTDDIARLARNKGHDGVVISNIVDHGPAGRFSTKAAREPSSVTVVPDPANIRSINAAFDPDNIGKPNLLGSAAPVALGAGLLSALGSDESVAGDAEFGSKSYQSLPQKSPNQIQAAPYPAAVQASGLLNQLELPVVGKPFEGLADYLYHLGYGDKPSITRSAGAALDIMP